MYKKKPRTGPGRRPINWLSGTLPTTKLVSEMMQIWKETPRNVLIIDLEYVTGVGKPSGRIRDLEIAIADAEDQWIVEQTTIDELLNSWAACGEDSAYA